MKVLIVEDEKIIAERLERLIREIVIDPKLEVHISHSIEHAQVVLSNTYLDVMFLDLNVNNQSGFNLLDKFLAEPFHTIIVSAYKSEAIRAFEYGVLDFIPKPFNKKRIDKSLDRLRNREEAPTEFLFCKDQGSIKKVEMNKLDFVKSFGSYTMLHLDGGIKLINSKSIENLSLILPSRFERIHKSYIVDMYKSEELLIESGGKYFVKLITGDTVPLSRKKYADIKKKWFSS